jgi:hypothetical protein
MLFPEEQNTLRAIWMTNFQLETQWSSCITGLTTLRKRHNKTTIILLAIAQ